MVTFELSQFIINQAKERLPVIVDPIIGDSLGKGNVFNYGK